jgi:hypothetical protein
MLHFLQYPQRAKEELMLNFPISLLHRVVYFYGWLAMQVVGNQLQMSVFRGIVKFEESIMYSIL